MERRKFEQLAEQAYARIPVRFRRRLHNVVIVIEDEPEARIGRGHELLGLYHGLPLTQRGWARYSSLPDRICLYQGPLERAARSESHLKKLVAETLWHEVGHYFGLNEAEIRRMERRLRATTEPRP